MKITKFKTKASLDEDYQQLGLYFSFISAPKHGLKQCHPLVKCRDFLQDAVRCSIPGSNTTNCSIYGFIFDYYTNPKIDLLKTRLLVTYKDKQDILDCSIKMMYSLKLIHYYEEIMNIKVKTRLKQLNHPDFKQPLWIFTGNKAWMSSPLLISLYTFLIRLGDKKIEFNGNNLEIIYEKLIEENNISDEKDKDIIYLSSIYKTLYSITKNYKKILSKESNFDELYLTKDTSIYSFHHNSGIVSFGKGTLYDKKINNDIKKSIGA